MRYDRTPIEGLVVVDLEPKCDERGFFSRVFDDLEFPLHGLPHHFSQMNTSFSARAGTLRGLHYQVYPHGEGKLVKCLRGSVFDVAVDIRANSPTFGQWWGTELTAQNRRMLYVPQGCAHGFLTLEDDTEVLYPCTVGYNGPSERVLAWNDPNISISWPRQPSVISEKDQNGGSIADKKMISGY